MGFGNRFTFLLSDTSEIVRMSMQKLFFGRNHFATFLSKCNIEHVMRHGFR